MTGSHNNSLKSSEMVASRNLARRSAGWAVPISLGNMIFIEKMKAIFIYCGLTLATQGR
jgi:hypothetical protein